MSPRKASRCISAARSSTSRARPTSPCCRAQKKRSNAPGLIPTYVAAGVLCVFESHYHEQLEICSGVPDLTFASEWAAKRAANVKSTPLRAAALLAFFTMFAAASAGPLARAQTNALGLAGGDNSNKPVNIQADSGIEWQQNNKVYIARGNAKATLGDDSVT